MKNLIFLILIFACFSSMEIDLSLTEQELQEIVKASFLKVSNKRQKIPIKYEKNFGIGKLQILQIEISELIFNEDSIKISLIQNPNSISVSFQLDYFILNLDANIEVGINYKPELNLQLSGLNFQAILLFEGNKVVLKDENVENFSIKSINLIKGQGTTEKLIKAAIDYLLQNINSIINKQVTINVAEYIKQEKWKQLIPSSINKINSLQITNEDKLAIKFTIDTFQIIQLQNRGF